MRMRVIAGTGQLGKLFAVFALHETGVVVSGRQCCPQVAKGGSWGQQAGLGEGSAVPAVSALHRHNLCLVMSTGI